MGPLRALGLVLSFVCLLLLLGGCILFLAGDPCMWRGTAEAWLDDNGNGRRDPGEQPAPGVLIYGDYPGKPPWSEGVTDSEGQLAVVIVGCEQAAEKGYGINALAPAGYKPTTPSRIAAPSFTESNSLDLQEPFAFGFQVERQAAPVVARRAFTGCTSFKASGHWQAVAGDGSLWAETYEGLTEKGRIRDLVLHLAPDRNPEIYHAPSDLDEYTIHGLAAAPDGTVWAATSLGVTRLDGTVWRAYTTTHGLPPADQTAPTRADQVAIDPDGTVWARVVDRLRWFDAASDRWLSCPDAAALPRGWDTELAQAVNGTLYLVSGETVLELAHRQGGGQNGNCVARQVTLTGLAGVFRGPNYKVFPAPDGTFWAHGLGPELGPTLARYDPSNQQWTQYTYRSTGGALAVNEINSLLPAADGSVWLATQGQSVYRLAPGGDGGTWEQYVVGDEPVNTSIYRLYFTPDGAAWLTDIMKGIAYHCASRAASTVPAPTGDPTEPAPPTEAAPSAGTGEWNPCSLLTIAEVEAIYGPGLVAAPAKVKSDLSVACRYYTSVGQGDVRLVVTVTRDAGLAEIGERKTAAEWFASARRGKGLMGTRLPGKIEDVPGLGDEAHYEERQILALTALSDGVVYDLSTFGPKGGRGRRRG